MSEMVVKFKCGKTSATYTLKGKSYFSCNRSRQLTSPRGKYGKLPFKPRVDISRNGIQLQVSRGGLLLNGLLDLSSPGYHRHRPLY